MHASRWRKYAVSMLLACLGLVPISVVANDALTRFQLDNGLNVIVQVDRRAPVAVVQTWYGVGGGDEPEGMTGVSHVLEHMMFKGTKKCRWGSSHALWRALVAVITPIPHRPKRFISSVCYRSPTAHREAETAKAHRG